MTQTETTSSTELPQSANDAVFSNATNTAVNNVINIDEARKRFKQANSSSQSLIAWAIDLIRRLTGTETNLSVSEYAGLVALRTQAIATPMSAANDSINLDSQESKKVA